MQIGNETRIIVGYNVLREVTIDKPFDFYLWEVPPAIAVGSTATFFTVGDPKHLFTITTGNVYAVYVQSVGCGMWSVC
jgi:hypothetical protein